jgi:hypothetical protein
MSPLICIGKLFVCFQDLFRPWSYPGSGENQQGAETKKSRIKSLLNDKSLLNSESGVLHHDGYQRGLEFLRAQISQQSQNINMLTEKIPMLPPFRRRG